MAIRYRDKTPAELAAEAAGRIAVGSGAARPEAAPATTPEGVASAGKRGKGRPGTGKPWEALGMSRSLYFAKKKAGEVT